MEVLRTTAEDPFFVGTINCSDMPHHLFKLEDACIFFCHSGEARIEIDLLEYDIMPNTQIIFLPNSIINYSYASPDLSISYITTVQRNYPIGSVDLNRNHSSDVLV